MIVPKSRSTPHYDELLKILGEDSHEIKLESPFDFIQIASDGLRARVILNFKTHFNISIERTAAMLNISGPTLYRWIRSNKLLESIFSVKLLEVANLFLYGSEVFRSKENFIKWMHLPNTALGGMEPHELIVFSNGVSKVKDIIGRIEHGVYS